MDNIQAAILNVKLKYLDEENRKRKEVARKYDEGIKNPFIILPENLFDNDNVYHLYPILTKFRNQLQDYLKDMGIETIIHYPVPPHKQTCFPQYNHISLPMTERMADMELSIPISQVMTDKEVQTVIDALNSFTKP
jgi:dTDP-4-amino-4,6-dideoxygalactose transaminase